MIHPIEIVVLGVRLRRDPESVGSLFYHPVAHPRSGLYPSVHSFNGRRWTLTVRSALARSGEIVSVEGESIDALATEAEIELRRFASAALDFADRAARARDAGIETRGAA